MFSGHYLYSVVVNRAAWDRCCRVLILFFCYLHGVVGLSGCVLNREMDSCFASTSYILVKDGNALG